jgi:hypothetical protein
LVIAIAVIERTLKAFKAFHFLTSLGFEHHRVEHLLLPAVAVLAFVHVWTAVFVILEEHILFPIWTRFK